MITLPPDNLAYPILLLLKSGGSGTGFFVNLKGQSYLITAKHVLQNKQGEIKADFMRLIAQPRDVEAEDRTVFEVNLAELKGNGHVISHPDRDISAIRMNKIVEDLGAGTKKVQYFPGIKMIQSAKSGIVGAAEPSIKRFDEVVISNEVFTFGYPSSIGMKKQPQIDYQRPLLRKGIVAGKNRANKTIILDCQVFPGNSGGPVVELERVNSKGKISVIGVVTQQIPYFSRVRAKHQNQPMNLPSIENSGYSVIEPMDSVIDLLSLT
jgi:hypothetical protein